jgi:hypothetical protein
MFLINMAVSENDVVIAPVLFLAIIMVATMREIRATPKAVYKQNVKLNIRVKRSTHAIWCPKVTGTILIKLHI